MTPTDDRSPTSSRLLVALFLLMAVVAGIDLITDLQQSISMVHVLLELLMVAIGLLAASAIALRLRRATHDTHVLRAQAAGLKENLRASQEEAARWRGEAATFIAGLSTAIDAQFARWGLSPAEREIALLLLKGLSHKEVASVRSVSETTIRQQARSLYRKAGLSGRNELAAFFLEDLLGPQSRLA